MKTCIISHLLKQFSCIFIFNISANSTEKNFPTRIESGESALTQPQMSSGGLGLGEALLASAAGAIIGSWIGNKLFNNPNYQQNRQRSYKSPTAYQRSVNSFNKAKQSSTATKSRSTRSGFFGSSKTGSKSTFGSIGG